MIWEILQKKNLKSYRNSELKWFLLANILFNVGNIW